MKKKRNFKKDLFMAGLIAAVAASTAVTGHYFKKALQATRQAMLEREYGYAFPEPEDIAEHSAINK